MAVICVVVEAAVLRRKGSIEGCVSYACVLGHLSEQGTPAALGLRLVELSRKKWI